MKSTPTAALEILLSLTPIGLFETQVADLTVVKLFRSGDWVGLKAVERAGIYCEEISLVIAGIYCEEFSLVIAFPLSSRSREFQSEIEIIEGTRLWQKT